jgi:hypothetical protein
MSRLLELIRKRRAELQAQGLEHLGPITDEHRIAALRGVIADAQHDPAVAEQLREARAASPEFAAVVDEIECKRKPKRAPKSPQSHGRMMRPGPCALPHKSTAGLSRASVEISPHNHHSRRRVRLTAGLPLAPKNLDARRRMRRWVATASF